MHTLNQDPHPSPEPVPLAMSLVLVAMDNFETVRKTVAALRSQTVRERLELILVTPSLRQLAMPDGALEGFGASSVVEVGEGKLFAQARAVGTRAGRADLIGFVEDHCFPESDWAEVMIEAHKSEHAAVGPRFFNANTRTVWSWADYLLNFGSWSEPGESRAVEGLAWHNASYKRASLRTFDSSLERMLAVEGTLMQALRKKGETLFLETRARVHHLNMSRPDSFAREMYHSGRLWGATRARGWNPLRRVFFFTTSPLIPLVRARSKLTDWRRHRDSGALPPALAGRVRALMIVGLVLHTCGEAVGYLLGEGNSAQRKCEFESGRTRYLCRADQEDERASLLKPSALVANAPSPTL